MISIFELFSIGLGPSSSHTVGPMRAAYAFCQELIKMELLTQVNRIQVEIFGSLAYTGKGHATNKAILLGLENNLPDAIDPDYLPKRYEAIIASKKINLANKNLIEFDYETQFIFNLKDLLPLHTNGMRFSAYDKQNKLLLEKEFYSIGGGFIITGKDDLKQRAQEKKSQYPYPFDTAAELLALCHQHNKKIWELIFENEATLRSPETVRKGILHIVEVMEQSIERGMKTTGFLPGGLNVRRRAPDLIEKLKEHPESTISHTEVASLDWLNVYAIAVNEENAAGSRVVTAPTNGAAGVLPAVLHYYKAFYNNVGDDEVINFMLTASAIATLYKKGASISAAEVGCQGEVGVASSMAAAAMAAALGGTVEQIASAAEIAMEHNLGLTCDPVGGLVQIPCIERNAIGSVKAVNIARLALLETGQYKKISLDKVIETMLRTGRDMNHHYKETSLGGLAKIKVNVIEC